MKDSFKKVTIFDVANAAGVSISTVSRVVNGNYRVNPELEQKVRKAIDEMGYTPDSVARGMKSKYRYVIGYIVSDITNQHFTVISKEIEKAIAPLGFNLLVCSTESDRNIEKRAIKMLLSNRIDGLIINTSGKNDAYIADISNHLPVVLLHRRIQADAFSGDYIGSDNYGGGVLLAECLIEKHHNKIGLITSDNEISTFKERTAGFLDTMSAAGIDIPKEHIAITAYTEEGGEQAIDGLMKSIADLSAVAVMNNATALGVMQYCRNRGITIPDDLSIVSFGDIEHDDLLYVKPTHTTQDPVDIGRRTGKLILRRIYDRKAGIEEIIIPSGFVQGNSVRNNAKE
jgi:LacI family transcriptional regulator